MRFTLRQLHYFVSIVDAGSMSRAAEGLNITPTSLSLQMKQLEELIGAKLFRRHSRGVLVTERGTALYNRTRDLLERIDALERDFVDAGTVAPRTVRVGVTPAVARMVGIEALTGAADRFAAMTLMLSEGWTSDMVPKLVTGALDFVIAYDLVAQGDIEVLDFYDEEFVFACHADRYPEGRIVTIEDIVCSELVFYGQDSISWRSVRDAAEAAGLVMPPGQTVQSIDIWRALICRGLGTSVAPLGTVGDEVRRGEIAVHRIADAPIVRRIGMAALKETLAAGRENGFVHFISELLGRKQPRFG